nr:MAG TPA: chromosome partition protein [Caudoviricetes sp.]
MKAIQLKSITLRNWRGEKERTTQFHTDGTVTRICGRNGLGKSRHMDAFCWLLFGKDSKDRKDFNLRTTDEKGNPLQHCECSVEGTLIVDGTEITVKREYKEQWVKPRGQVEEVFKGNVTECTWNGVPVRVNEYKERINSEIIDENLFKMLTNTEYFLSLKQDVQREVLMSIAGAKTDDELAEGNAEFTALIDMLSGKSLSDYRRQIAAEKKRLKAQADEIKPRIDQTDKMKPEVEDWGMLEDMLTGKKKELEEINELLHSEDARKQSVSDRKATLNREKRQIEQQQKDILAEERRNRQEDADKKNEARNAIEKELKNIHSERSSCNIDITRAKERIAYLTGEVVRIKGSLENLRTEWHSIRATQYAGDNICPHCGQLLPENMIQDALQKFEEYKHNNLKENQSRGKSLSAQLESYQEELNRRNEELVEYSKKLTAIDECIAGLYDRLNSAPKVTPSAINENEIPAYTANLKRLDEIEKEMANITYTQTDTELSERAELVKSDIKKLEIQLNNRTIIANYDKEIERLEKEGRELAQKIADIEKREFIAAQFSRARIEDCESRLNSMFGMVRWKLFDTTLDGNEFETCIPMIDGVAYGTCNTAKQVNAGIDITNTLAKHYEVYAPMFIDRAESVNTFIASNAQMIFLQVTTDNQLTVK